MEFIYHLEPTKNKNVFREVDQYGNWNRYFIQDKKIYLDSVNHILDSGFYKGAGLENWIERTPEEERATILKAAGIKGRNVHQAIDKILTAYSTGFSGTFDVSTISLTLTEKLMVRSWSHWWNLHSPILIAFEEPVYNIAEKYAGTFDDLLIITRECGQKACPCRKVIGKVGMWDRKTSKRIRPSHKAQTVAYANGDNIPDFFPNRSPFTQLIDYVGILRLTDTDQPSYEAQILKDKAMVNSLERFREAQGAKEALQPLPSFYQKKSEVIQRFQYRSG